MTHWEEISTGDRTLAVTIGPILDADDEVRSYLVTTRDVTEQAAADRLRTLIMLGSAAAMVLLLGFGMWRILVISFRPLNEAVAVLDKLSQGEIDVDIPQAKNDEVGMISAGLERFKTNLMKTRELEEEQRCQQE